MRKPIETVYIDPAYQGNSSITDIPMHTPLTNVVYGENPNLIVNEYGQTMVNPDIPVPINTNTPKPVETIKDEIANEIKNTINEIVNSPSNTPKGNPPTGGTTGGTNITPKPVDNLIKDLKDIKSASTTTPKPKTNYLLYGLVGIGALIVFMGVFKKK
jgi:hypothetical protein